MSVKFALSVDQELGAGQSFATMIVAAAQENVQTMAIQILSKVFIFLSSPKNHF
jgi:hypothetical protein